MKFVVDHSGHIMTILDLKQAQTRLSALFLDPNQEEKDIVFGGLQGISTIEWAIVKDAPISESAVLSQLKCASAYASHCDAGARFLVSFGNSSVSHTKREFWWKRADMFCG